MHPLSVTYHGGEGKALVLLHGWGFNSQVWQGLFPKLLEKYAVYTVDLPGFGRSQIMDWEEFKENFFKALPSMIAVLGWSMGGGYGIKLTA